MVQGRSRSRSIERSEILIEGYIHSEWRSADADKKGVVEVVINPSILKQPQGVMDCSIVHATQVGSTEFLQHRFYSPEHR